MTTTTATWFKMANVTDAMRVRAVVGYCGEQTEAYVFEQTMQRYGLTRDEVDAAIGEALDAGYIRSTLIDARNVGHGYVPALVAA